MWGSCPCSRNQSASPACNSALGPAAVPASVSMLYGNVITANFIWNLCWHQSANTPCNRQIPFEPALARRLRLSPTRCSDNLTTDNVRYRGQFRKYMFAVRFTHFDPKQPLLEFALKNLV